jgi:Ubiquitin-like modifier-activating enzyme ATG7 N-terminus
MRLRHAVTSTGASSGLTTTAAAAPTSSSSSASNNRSIVLTVQLTGVSATNSNNQTTTVPVCPSSTGWEPNSNGKLGPRVTDLSTHLDPVKLAEQSVNLNLKLMKWRLLPQLVRAIVSI